MVQALPPAQAGEKRKPVDPLGFDIPPFAKPSPAPAGKTEAPA